VTLEPARPEDMCSAETFKKPSLEVIYDDV
jgi:3,8-divinyl chlorophyllide a/chlorophyllide a reductase subunit X